MDEPVKSEDEANVSPVLSRDATIVALLIIFTQIVIALVTYPFLPDQVPSHWNAAGQINSYMPKLVNAILWPGTSIGIYILVRGLLALGPALGTTRASARNNLNTAKNVANLIVVAVMAFMLVLQIVTTSIAFGIPLDIMFIVNLCVSVLFIFIGNYMGKVRRNFYVGIRTPWTLVNDEVWNRTHRLGGWLFVLAGLVGIVLGFVPTLEVWGIVGLVVLVALITFVYSYVIYRQIETHGGEPLSHPFD